MGICGDREVNEVPARQSTGSPGEGGDPWSPTPVEPSSAAPEPAAAGADEHRRAPRTNMFIAGTAELEGRAIAVRLRNMSEGGALVEAAEPIRAGAFVVLRRGGNEAGGRVAWSHGLRCGIAFTGPVCVATWMGRPVPRDGEGQRRVDAIQAQIRNGATPILAAHPARPEVSAQLLQQRLSEELVQLKRIIDTIGETLAGEPEMLERHAGSMQQFDIASQTLAHLARILTAPDPVEALSAIGMDSLRRRLSHGEG
jgi:hypothetical protein